LRESDFTLEELVPDEVEKDIKKAAEISMGSDILEEDELNIRALAQ